MPQYTKDFNKANHFDIMAGYEYSHMKYWETSGASPCIHLPKGKNDAGEPLAGTVKVLILATGEDRLIS